MKSIVFKKLGFHSYGRAPGFPLKKTPQGRRVFNWRSTSFKNIYGRDRGRANRAAILERATLCRHLGEGDLPSPLPRFFFSLNIFVVLAPPSGQF